MSIDKPTTGIFGDLTNNADQRFRGQILDVLEAINATEEFIDGMDLTSFSNDQKTIYAVERSIGIIGAVSKRLPITFINQHPEISWRNLIGVGERLIYGYFEIDIGKLWHITQSDIPKLKTLLNKLLADPQ
ncbi:protein of unknown function DUF86 [Thalassoporum mexicanum PCC 7367]|uniref:HepT-like ribonuclease domain-containing protein n=1 Tax=Thalassoporum mexicanum TaxID=3457544 RepID=UPI00029FC257|nr:HepT-like ribonuclease domain-containing protein [Pseudanabaena sp. PCC 7367]AFY68921.1 protein of unknown function DUF86 [Pseudanabaena sp. PCC 7367]